MARIVVGSYMIRYPLGGMLSWSLQWLVGLRRLGHEVFFVERAHYADACFDPSQNSVSDDSAFGRSIVDELFSRYELAGRWCFADFTGNYFGCSRGQVLQWFADADAFLDLGTHGSWMEEASRSRLRVVVDGEPGYNQMKMELKPGSGLDHPAYDFRFTNGANVGTPLSSSPTAGREWKSVFNPVVPELFDCGIGNVDDPITTVMNWQAHGALLYRGTTYGQKDVEFEKFMMLPTLTSAKLELGVSGKVPADRLLDAGWRLRNAHEVTASFDSYREYIAGSSAEFSVCKSAYVSTNSGWFSDRSAAYLASARPVVMQETGFSAHLPCGEGLFAVKTVDEAAAAIHTVKSDYARHASRAREIAREYLAHDRILPSFLQEIGL